MLKLQSCLMKKVILIILMLASIGAKAQDTLFVLKASVFTLLEGSEETILDTDAEILFLRYPNEYRPYYEFRIKDSKNHPRYSNVYTFFFEYMSEVKTPNKWDIRGSQGFNLSIIPYGCRIQRKFSDNVERQWTEEKGWEIVEGYDDWIIIFYDRYRNVISYIADNLQGDNK